MRLFSVLQRFGAIVCFLFFSVKTSYAVDSYRFLHVHIDTLWFIFLFLLCILFIPFILIAILTWHYAGTQTNKEQRVISAEGEK